MFNSFLSAIVTPLSHRRLKVTLLIQSYPVPTYQLGFDNHDIFSTSLRIVFKPHISKNMHVHKLVSFYRTQCRTQVFQLTSRSVDSRGTAMLGWHNPTLRSGACCLYLCHTDLCPVPGLLFPLRRLQVAEGLPHSESQLSPGRDQDCHKCHLWKRWISKRQSLVHRV